MRLGPSAIPTLCEIASDPKADNAVRDDADRAIERYAKKRKDESIYSLDLPRLRADKACKEYMDNKKSSGKT